MAITIKNNYLALTFGEVYESLDAVGSSDVTWQTSNPSIVSLSNSQSYYNHSLVTLTAGSTAGTAIITAVSNADNTIYDTCEVHVMQSVVHANGVNLDTTNLYLRVNETRRLVATVTPSTATNKHVRWGAPVDGIIRVDENGLVTAQREGTSSVVATTMDGGYMRTCSVVVSSNTTSISSVELSQKSIVLVKGHSTTLSFTVVTNDGSIVPRKLGVVNQDSSIAKYYGGSSATNSNKFIVGIKAYSVGFTTIKFYHTYDPSKYEILNVTVVASEEDVFAPVLGVVVSETSVTVPPNSSFTLTGQQKVSSSNSFRYDNNVRFETGDTSIATITSVSSETTQSRASISTGREGTTKIYVISNTDHTQFATCTVKVEASQSHSPDDDIINPVVSVSISEHPLEIAEGDSRQLTAVVTGQYSNQAKVNRNVTWNSSNNDVVSVNSFGRIIGMAVGTAVITAVSDENRYIYGSCTVTVRERKESDGPIILPDEEQSNGIDTIIRVDYNDDGTFSLVKLFEGDLNLDARHPIESVVYHETDEIQKIYWVDGKNVLRFMNFMEEPDKVTGRYPWQISGDTYDNTYFDSNRSIQFDVDVKITKDNSGNTRPNGVIQYLLTYYNKHGQESGYAWISDLVYLSPVNSGGAADGTNMNSVILDIHNLDTRFSDFRIYSIFRSSLNGTTTAYIVYDGKTSAGNAVVIDNNSHLIAVDSSRLLYLGSQDVRSWTLTHKDQTLFLGDLQSIGKTSYSELENDIRRYMFSDVANGLSGCIEFYYSSGDDDIPYNDNESYIYESQLGKTSSSITTFKGGEKYRFALCFRKKDGAMTEAFWIGDAVNNLYPVIEGNKIHRVLARCKLPAQIIDRMKSMGFSTVNLMIAEATYADRSVKAQGILNPTVFNVWDRYKGRLYSSASWITRPRQSEFAWKHFEPIKKSIFSTGEIQCNYWTSESDPTPYYILKNYGSGEASYTETFDSGFDFDFCIVLYGILCKGVFNTYSGGCILVTIKMHSFGQDALSALNNLDFNQQYCAEAYLRLIEKSVLNAGEEDYSVSFEHPDGYFSGNISLTTLYSNGSLNSNNSIQFFHAKISEFLVNSGVPSKYILPYQSQVLEEWCQVADDDENKIHYFQYNDKDRHTTDVMEALNWKRGSTDRWYAIADVDFSDSFGYMPSYYKKHLMFIDENTITLNSPEFDNNAVLLDGAEDYKLRIVGIAKITSNIADYVVNAEPGKLPGENLVSQNFTSLNGLLSWPLWKEYGYSERLVQADGETKYEHKHENPKFWTPDDYIYDGSIRRYWLYMWNHPGNITTFSESEYNDSGTLESKNENYSILNNKTFANLKYSNGTMYNNLGNIAYEFSYDLDSLRSFHYTSSQYVGIKVGNDTKHYNAVLNESLSMPARHMYPVIYSSGSFSSANDDAVLEGGSEATLYTNLPVSITYASSPHVVMTLHTDSDSEYAQTILPQYWGHSEEAFENKYKIGEYTGAILPWVKETDDAYPFKDYYAGQGTFRLSDDPVTHLGRTVTTQDKYLYIGEIYYDFSDNDTRYGGVTDSAVQNNRFILAGPQYIVSELRGNGSDYIIANQGDTYFQRWDCLKTKPYSTGAENNVIDITSVMVETHVNIDGRTDLQRGSSYLASFDTEKFGQINPVYSQNNNFITQRDLDEDFNLDAYRSSITWTLEKHDSEDIDEWTHITLANTLKLDADKGICRALRRINNSIISFQDRGISEILFNSRTQLSTQDGVPVEIANSGKVDGKRYITNKYGCVNKWSIIEGKNALYFVDNINKAFCAFNGQAIDNLSTRLGFGAWFREINNVDPWSPAAFNNIVSYYDKVHSDIYLVRGVEDDKPCLVYNETFGAFTSFFDYRNVLMMSNVQDRFVSFNNHALWLQNEGLYCNFFGKQYDYWTQYRVTPEPFSDKIWTNIDYRADFFEVLNDNAESVVSETELINGDIDDTYKEWETFTDYKVWDEYQDTGFTPFAHDSFDRDDVRKKFRIWRLTIPRALKEGTNKHGMDRIRNPWINLLFRKSNVDGKYLMQLHDIVVKYFE